jgi:hypothetical protein
LAGVATASVGTAMSIYLRGSVILQYRSVEPVHSEQAIEFVCDAPCEYVGMLEGVRDKCHAGRHTLFST